MATLVDSHCHLDFEQFDADREAVLERAIAAGVTRFINPATDMASSKRALKLARQYENIYAAVGFHPYEATAVNDETLAQLADLARDPRVVAIGEIGLDFYRDRAPKEAQYRAFEAQLALATTLRLPVIVHQRQAAADTMAILRRWAAGGEHSGLVLHAFSGDEAMVEEAASLNFYMGVGGPITFKNARDYPRVVARIPPSRLLVETDAPFLSPHPFRGRRNEPARVVLVAQKLAALFNMDFESFAQQVTQNTETLFQFT